MSNARRFMRPKGVAREKAIQRLWARGAQRLDVKTL